MRDIEILLRSFAMLLQGSNYSSSMVLFLNRFSKTAKSYSTEEVQSFERLFDSFIDVTADLPDNTFFGNTGKFSITLFEALFAAIAASMLPNPSAKAAKLLTSDVERLKNDPAFSQFSLAQSTNKGNVDGRLDRARQLLCPAGG
jgi:hypothetical protein